ncbi:MAG: hypothetical protein Q9162_005388 [Coniocarpon cinnabarinum]
MALFQDHEWQPGEKEFQLGMNFHLQTGTGRRSDEEERQLLQSAEYHLRRSADQRGEALGVIHHDTIRSKNALEEMLSRQEKFKKAEELLRPMVVQIKEERGVKDDDYLDSKYRLSLALYHQQKLDEAEQLLRQLERQFEDAFGDDCTQLVHSKHLLSLTLSEQKKHREAEQQSLQTQELAEKISHAKQNRRFFVHERKLPDLPPGHEWETQIAKYCPPHFSRTLNRKGAKGVFCHRGLYERAVMLMENSTSSIMNGTSKGLLLHEVDLRMDAKTGKLFLAHDEVAGRVTAEARNWGSISVQRTDHAGKHFNAAHQDWGSSSYMHTGEKIAFVEDMLADADIPRRKELCVQLDLRGDDFVHAITHFNQQPENHDRILLKSYNLDFASAADLERALTVKSSGAQWCWTDLRSSLRIMMVFYARPVVNQLLQEGGIDPEAAELKDRQALDFQRIYEYVMKQVLSFIEALGENLIPEIVHNGIGLHYNVNTNKTRDPKDGTPITEEEIIFDSRVDRAMIQAQLDLKERYPNLKFGSCTRLYEVRTTAGKEYTAGIQTGALRPLSHGPEGIATKLRSMHGGLYPQSDLVVADDPYAEIAARTWIDEHAAGRLDRKELLERTYDEWIGEVPEVADAVEKLNGPFLPNTVGRHIPSPQFKAKGVGRDGGEGEGAVELELER